MRRHVRKRDFRKQELGNKERGAGFLRYMLDREITFSLFQTMNSWCGQGFGDSGLNPGQIGDRLLRATVKMLKDITEEAMKE